MASRLGRSFYRFSSVNRPTHPPAGTTSTQESAQYDDRRLPSVTRDQSAEPTSPKRVRSPAYSPTRESLPASPTYSTKKAASPPSSPTYRPTASRPISSPRKPAAESSPKYRPTTQPRSPPEVEQKPIIYKTVEKPAKSERHHESGKPPHKQQPNAIRIAGENLGAVMEIVQSPNKREGGQIIRKKETTGTHNISNEHDEASKEKGSHNHKGKETTSLPTNTFMNSNFQTVNNCLLYNASLTHHDPGLHLVFSRKPTGDRFTVNEDKKHIKS